MDEISFDPRSWAGRDPSKKDAPKKPDAEDSTDSRESLPEMWRGVASSPAQPSSATSAAPAEPAARPATPPDDAAAVGADAGKSASLGRMPIMLGASAALLAGAAALAWFTREPPTLEAVPVVADAGAPVEALPAAAPQEDGPIPVERALNLADPGDLFAALASMHIPPEEADAAARAAAGLLSAPGNIKARITLLPAGEGFTLDSIHASYADGSGAAIMRDASGTFTGQAIAAELTSRVTVLRGELDSESFYSSAVSAGVIDTLIPEFINAFAYDFNLASEIEAGDTFEVAYEQAVNQEGDAVGQPQLLFASLTTKDKSLDLYRFQLPGGKVGWYDGNGALTQRGFMRTPIDGARISSKFGMRFHPVLKYNRLHGGVDFAAPTGTPIYAAAAGTVVSATPSRCAGNMAILSHDKGYQTRYFHLSRYADGLSAGSPVQQGQTIGFVGNTGTCTTGPHLHYEVHVEGKKIDPLSVKTADSERKRIDGDALAAFRKERDRVDVARAQQSY